MGFLLGNFGMVQFFGVINNIKSSALITNWYLQELLICQSRFTASQPQRNTLQVSRFYVQYVRRKHFLG
jgi:hypothetical protein